MMRTLSMSWLGLALVTLSICHGQELTNNPVTPRHLDPVIVTGSLHDVTSESERVGPANQPEWTTRRAFAETDIYVIPQGAIELNQFYILSHPREGKPEHLFETEIELGLPWRTQFDIEPNYRIESGTFRYDSTRLELPHALADWGKIPFNPTIDFGWRFNNQSPDSFLFRLLLAEEFSPRWHFGANFGYEQQVGDDHETTYEINAALSYVAADRKLAIGAEFLAEFESDDEDEHASEVLLGPLFLYKPTPETHAGLVAFAGLTDDAPAVEIFFILGIDLEPFAWKGGQKGVELPRVRRPR